MREKRLFDQQTTVDHEKMREFMGDIVSSGAIGAEEAEKLRAKAEEVASSHQAAGKDDDFGPIARAQAKRDKGTAAFKEGEIPQAIVEYTESLLLDPSVAAVHANRSECFLRIGELDKALLDAENCIKIEPEHKKAWFRKAKALLLLNRYAEAVPCFGKVLTLDPNNVKAKDSLRLAQAKAHKEATKKK